MLGYEQVCRGFSKLGLPSWNKDHSMLGVCIGVFRFMETTMWGYDVGVCKDI